MDAVNARLFLIEKLQRKYGLSAAELPAFEAELKAELDSIELGSSRRDELAEELARLKKGLATGADALSRKRGRARTELEKRLKDEFEALGLGRAALSVSLTRATDPNGVYERDGERFRLTPAGVDAAEFLFSANPGEELRPLRKVASGGELSRIMLALKSVLSQADPVPTLVFDEIDVGIGGKVAEAVGKRLARLARAHQVICITHLPQLAKYADRHLLVSKSTRGGRTLTAIRPLDAEGRVEELARMTSGAAVTGTSIAHAREMLETAARNRRD
jgi:DNA repair protein RecN (Recombination protein N)